jgi:DNA-binding PadR family transcriptional regulator
MKLPKYIEFKGFLTLHILHLIKKNKVCGDDIAEIIGSKKGNKLTPGTIYPALKYLRKNKLIIYKQLGRKKIYSLTKKGDCEYKIIKRMFRKMFKEMI